MNYKHLVRFINGNEISQVFCTEVKYADAFTSSTADGKVAVLVNPSTPVATDETIPFEVVSVESLQIPYQAIVSLLDITITPKVPSEAGSAATQAN